jgi:hypothetical protein
MNPITLFLVIACVLVGVAFGEWVNLYLALPFAVAAMIIALSLKMANAWQKFVILRAGKLQSVKGPGLFMIVPVLDNVAAVIDERIQTTAFNAEQALTKDTVPVNVDAIIFWHVHDAEKAALKITNYRQAIDRVAQTSLREMIGSSMLAALLSDRKTADEHLRDEIGRKPRNGACRSPPSRSVTSPSRWRCKMPCPARRKQSARSRPASFSVRLRPKSPGNLSRHPRSTPIIRRRSNCAP